VAFAAVSRAPVAKFEAYKQRMGWSFVWVSSSTSDFNYDYRVSFTPGELREAVFNFGTAAPEMSDREGVSVFYRDEVGTIFHTSAYGHGESTS